MTTKPFIQTKADLALVYQDQHLIVIDKPANLLSVPGRGDDKYDSAYTRLLAAHDEVHVVHRLDMATSGLLVFAKDKTTLASLHRLFAKGKTAKAYEAVVQGSIKGNQGCINFPLICDWPNRPRQMISYTQGKASLTRWRCLNKNAEQSRLRLFPKTGRSHQLRVHCLGIGHPILGDDLYQRPSGADRLHLHACQLSFEHPVTGQWMEFNSPVPF